MSTSRGVTLGSDPAKEVTKLDSEPERSCRVSGVGTCRGFVKNTPSETRKTSSNIWLPGKEGFLGMFRGGMIFKDQMLSDQVFGCLG